MPPRRPQSKKKLPSKPAIQKNPLVVEDDSETIEKFKVELQWCVQNVEAAMQKASLKEREDMAKAHKTLTSTKAPHIKKRQVMSSLFGDYRTKMAQEESKLKIEMPRMKKKSVLPSRSVFLRKSALHFPNTTNGPLADCEEADVKIREAEREDSDLPGEGSTTSRLHTGELNPSGGEETSMTGWDAGNLSKRSTKRPEKVAHYSFPQSGRTFKFNFSSVS